MVDTYASALGKNVAGFVVQMTFSYLFRSVVGCPAATNPQ
jgi:hypothetical protein